MITDVSSFAQKSRTTAKVSVVMGSFNRCPTLVLGINAIREELANIEHEIIVVDGGSSDGALEWLIEQKDIITIVQHNSGRWRGESVRKRSWSYFMNLGFKAAQGEYICMLSDDALIVPGAIKNGMFLFDEKLKQNAPVGAVAFYFRDYPVRKKYAVAVNVGCLYVNHGLYLNTALKEIGYCDENYNFYFADTDLVLKLNHAGYACIRSEKSFVEHYFELDLEARSENNNELKEQDRLRLIDKWCGIAFEESERKKYLKIVGYWDYHHPGFHDSARVINKLIKVNTN